MSIPDWDFKHIRTKSALKQSYKDVITTRKPTDTLVGVTTQQTHTLKAH